MSEFLKRFLRDDVRQLGGDGPRALFLGAFGKHPGWDDHIEEDSRVPDLGLRTESLVAAKTLLYVQGIGRNIDSGAWEKLEPDQTLPHFNHSFLWQADGQYLAGRLWSSSDGKGRTRYPMVLAAHSVGVSLSWVLGSVFPRLERLRRDCAATRSAPEVGTLLDQARAELRARLDDDGRSVPPGTDQFARFSRHPHFGPNNEGLFRVLYQLRQQVGPYSPASYNPRRPSSTLRPQELRAPAAGSEPAQIFWGWSRILLSQLDPAVPFLLLWPTEQDWVDSIIGEPGPDQWFCLRVNRAKLPRASEVPFNLDDKFRAEAQATLDALIHGDLPRSSGSAVSRFFGSLFRA